MNLLSRSRDGRAWGRLPAALGTVALLAALIGSTLSGCGTGGLAVKKDIWEAEEDFERRQTSLSEKILQLEGRIAVLEEENAAFRYQMGELSKQLGELDSDFARGLEALRDGQQQLGIELEGRIGNVDDARESDRDDLVQRMQIVLEEVSGENEALREELAAIRSSVSVGFTHTVQRGETLATIAAKYGVTVADIVAANSITNPDVIPVGAELFVPER